MKALLTISKIVQYQNAITALFDVETGVKTIGAFVHRVEELGHQMFPNASSNKTELDKLNAFKGDILEVLVEIFFFAFSNDPAVGLRDYTPIPINEDYGVDGIGTNVNNDRCASQVKYKSNPLEQITYADIAKTYTSGRLTHGLALDKNDTIFLFTTGQGINAPCQNVFGNVVRVINRNIISGKIDNNNNFWVQAEQLIMLTLEQLKKR